MALSEDERRAAVEAGIVVFDDRLILDPQPPIDDATLAAVARRCAGRCQRRWSPCGGPRSAAGSADQVARSATEQLRRLVGAAVLDWRGALEQGTLGSQRRLRHLALARAASTDDVEVLARVVEQGGDPILTELATRYAPDGSPAAPRCC